MPLKMKLHILNVKHYATGKILQLTTIWEAIVPSKHWAYFAINLFIVVTPGTICAIQISTVVSCQIFVLFLLLFCPGVAYIPISGFTSVSSVALHFLTLAVPVPGTFVSLFIEINTAWRN